MDPIITSAAVSFATAFATSSFSKATGPAQALDDIMTIVGFDRLHEVAEKKRVKRELDVQQYKESIAQKVVAIPEDNLQEPSLAIVGPALEASKFYIEEVELREMFAKLVAASMDSTQNVLTHPSFVDLIKQMSTRDAQILKILKENIKLTVLTFLPIMKMVKQVDSYKAYVIFPLIAFFTENDDFYLNAISVNNLERLGIIETDFSYLPTDDSLYDSIRNNSLITSILESNTGSQLDKGLLRLTNYGQNFLTVCV